MPVLRITVPRNMRKKSLSSDQRLLNLLIELGGSQGDDGQADHGVLPRQHAVKVAPEPAGGLLPTRPTRKPANAPAVILIGRAESLEQMDFFGPDDGRMQENVGERSEQHAPLVAVHEEDAGAYQNIYCPRRADDGTHVKTLRIQSFARELPTRRSRELFCASRESIPPFRPGQGIRREIDFAPRPIQSSKCVSVVDKKITTGWTHDHVWPAIFAPLETAFPLGPSPHHAPPAGYPALRSRADAAPGRRRRDTSGWRSK